MISLTSHGITYQPRYQMHGFSLPHGWVVDIAFFVYHGFPTRKKDLEDHHVLLFYDNSMDVL